MGIVQHQEMHHEHPLQEIWVPGRGTDVLHSLSLTDGTASPSAARAGRFYVSRVVKKPPIDETNEPSSPE